MKQLCFLFCLFSLIACSDDKHEDPEPLQGIWSASTPFKGSLRAGAVSFTIGNASYVGLGIDTSDFSHPFKDFWMYKEGQWTRLADFPGGGRYGAVAFVINDIAYVGTGFQPDTFATESNYSDDFYTYNPTTGKWSESPVTSLPPTKLGENNGRIYAFAFTINNKGYVGTGHSYKSVLKDLYCFDGSTWTEIYFPGEARSGASAFVIDNKAVICLGASETKSPQYLCDVNIFDGTTQTWLSGAHPLVNLKSQTGDDDYDLIPRAYAVAFTSTQADKHTKGYIVTGIGQHAETCWEYDIEKDHWKQVSPLPASMPKRGYAVGFTLNNWGYVTTGGISLYNPIPTDMWSFTPENKI